MNCLRMQGRSARDCECKLLNGGWSHCPPDVPFVPLIVSAAFYERAKRAGINVTYMKVDEPLPVETPSKLLTTRIGERCDECGSYNVSRAGTCLLCQDCGSTSGGCS